MHEKRTKHVAARRWLVDAAAAACLMAIVHSGAAANVVLWDTGSSVSDATAQAGTNGWKQVPADLLALEADPKKASSDPGYYGREYSFKGDAVVENASLTALFQSNEGRVVIRTRRHGSSGTGKETSGGIVEIVPIGDKGLRGKISNCEILRNAADEVALKISFSGGNGPVKSAVFLFGRDEIVEVRPGETMKGMTLAGAIDYGVAPGFVTDDLTFSAAGYPEAQTIAVPAENLFLGLMAGGDGELVVAWPRGKQKLTLGLAGEQPGNRRITTIDFENDGQAFYIAPLAASGIWHREPLTPSFLEKEVAIGWKKPFPARWKTQLLEADVRTTFNVRNAKGQVWRGVPGSYAYPVWFDGEQAYFHLSKKVPPRGEALIYAVESEDTPATILTPVDVLKATLGRQAADAVVDISGRKLRTHHRRAGDGVRRACTCGCTEAIQAVFETRQEVAKKQEVQEALDDMIFFVQRHVARIDEYRRFADGMIQYLQEKQRALPDLKDYLAGLEQIVQQIPQEYTVQKENMKSPEYAAELTRQTLALTTRQDATNLKSYMDLLKAWRAMGGAQDYVVAQCHMITRKLCQEAGYSCAAQPKALAAAQEVRAKCRQVLRNPDGYEIWAEY